MTADLLLLQLLTGIALGCIFVLLALGLSLIFGMLTVVNFAHGAFYMVGAYIGVYLYGLTGNFWVSVVAAPLCIAAMGFITERFLIRPLYGRGIDYPLLLTFGLSYIFVEAIRMIFGLAGLPFGTPVGLRGAVNVGVGYFPYYRLFLMAFTAAITLAIWLVVERTRFGSIVRAGARDPEIVRVLGVDISRVRLIVFGIGTGLAGLAGILAAPIQAVTPEMGIPALAEAFVVTVIGGMGSLAGAVVAGLLVGVVVAMTSLFVPAMAKASVFFLMALILLIRPRGLFGQTGLMD